MKTVKNIANFLIAIIVTFAININMNKDLSFTQSFNGNSIVYLMIFILIYLLFKDIESIKNKRLTICSMILAIILALCETIGSSILINGDITSIFSVKGLVNFVGFSLLIYGIIYKLFSLLENKDMININAFQKTHHIKTIEKTNSQ